jgi:LysM repeat protein
LGLAGCGGGENNTSVEMPVGSPVSLVTPYHTTAPLETQAPTQTPAPTSTPPPLPTPTPFLHTVAEGETMIGIAGYYGVSLDELGLANPDVNPNYLSVGAQLIIPLKTDGEENPAASSAAPEILPVTGGAVSCIPNRVGGMWCFWPVTNTLEQPVENLAGLIHLYDQDGEQLGSQPVYSLVNLLKPGETIPMGAYFKPPLPDWETVQGQITNASAANLAGERYLAIEVTNLETLPVDDGGLAVEVNGTISFPALETEPALAYLWVVAMGYDDAGQVTGLRRWVAPAEGLGGAMNFEFVVYSSGRPIDRVEILAEARVVGE